MNRLVLSFLLLTQVTAISLAQNSKEFVLENQTTKVLRRSLEKQSEKGFIPVDVLVDTSRRNPYFSLRLIKPEADLPWSFEFELTDDQFTSLNEENEAKKMALVAHEEYELKKGNFHACIWHSNPKFKLHSAETINDPSSRPKPIPLGRVWAPDNQIPTDGGFHEACRQLEVRTEQFVRANDLPGFSVAAMVGNDMVYQRSFGYADTRLKRKLKVDHAFRLGEINNAITCIAVLQLIENGKLTLDQPAFELLGVEPWKPDESDADLKGITVGQLLESKAGFAPLKTEEPGLVSEKVQKKMRLSAPATPLQLIQYGISSRLSSRPGNLKQKSRFGMFVLARIVEKISGMSYEEYVLKYIAKPIGMESLAMCATNPKLSDKNLVTHLDRDGVFFSKLTGSNMGKWVPRYKGGIDFGLLDASDGWMASPIDVLRFANAIDPANKNRVLSAKGKLLLLDKRKGTQIRTHPSGPIWEGMVFQTQLIKQYNGYRFDRYFAELGASGGFTSFPEGISYCYFCNCSKTISGTQPTIFSQTLLEETTKVKTIFAKSK